MGHFDDRLRRLEKRFRDRGPTPQEVQAAWGRVTERARATLRGESVDEAQRARDRNAIERWAEAQGADLGDEVERAKAKLSSVNRARS